MTDRGRNNAGAGLEPDDLEVALYDHYRGLPTPVDPALASRVDKAMTERRPRAGIFSLARLGSVAAAGVAAIAILAVALLRPGVGPGAVATSAGPTFNVSAALTAQADMIGRMRSGGLWAAQGSYLMTSIDNGATWTAGHLPTPYGAIYVLDQTHAWVVDDVPGSNGLGPRLPKSGLVIERTSDGGRTWQKASISGVACDGADLSFVDTSHGFVVCQSTANAGSTTGIGEFWVYRSDDEGAAWTATGHSPGMAMTFTASDTTTLWATPDFKGSETIGVSLSVSRDGGATWSKVALPESSEFTPMGTATIAAGPVFWDASDGAFAVNVWHQGTSTKPAIFFYRTKDAGATWTLTKAPVDTPVWSAEMPSAVVGPTWVVVGRHGFADLAVSGDFGATWTEASSSGMPPNTPWLSMAFTDSRHGAGLVLAAPMTEVLMLTTDGGQTWHPADFGSARTRVAADPSLDAATAKQVATDFETFAGKEPASAWNRLSSYSQQQFGSESAFVSAESAIFVRVTTVDVGEATQDASVRNRLSLTPGIWNDMTTFADISRAYVVVVTFPGSSVAPQKLLVAPTTITGEWRVWVVPGA